MIFNGFKASQMAEIMRNGNKNPWLTCINNTTHFSPWYFPNPKPAFWVTDQSINFFFLFYRDNAMNINEFTALIKALFRNEKGRPYQVDNYMITEIFNIFNKQGVSNFLNDNDIKKSYTCLTS